MYEIMLRVHAKTQSVQLGCISLLNSEPSISQTNICTREPGLTGRTIRSKLIILLWTFFSKKYFSNYNYQFNSNGIYFPKSTEFAPHQCQLSVGWWGMCSNHQIKIQSLHTVISSPIAVGQPKMGWILEIKTTVGLFW